MVSLVVPVYNVKNYVEEFLDSVVHQTFNDYEAILVDDGSTDGTEGILDEYAGHFQKLRVVHKENGGCVSAWKRGVLEAKGDYIAFADPDDILEPSMLETQYRLATEHNADLVITGIKRFENGKIGIMAADNWGLSEGLYEGERLNIIKRNLFGNRNKPSNIFFFAKWNKLFRRDVVMGNLNYTNDKVAFGDDVCICASAIYDCNRLYYSYDLLYTYRIRNDSLTTVSFDVEQIDNAKLLIESVRKLLKDKGCLTDFVYYNDPSYHIIRLMRKIENTSLSRKEKKALLTVLNSHKLVTEYYLKKAGKFISKRRYFAIWLLKHNYFGTLIRIL